MHRWDARLVVLAMTSAGLFAGCGGSSGTQTAGATTPTIPTTQTAATKHESTSTTAPILIPGTAATFTATPAAVAIGQSVTYRGAACSTNQVQAVTPGGGLLTNIRPDANGSWSVRFVVADTSPIGRVQVSAICITPKGVAAHYAPVYLQISTYRHLDVQPGMTVHAGDTLTVTAVGSCAQGSVSVMLLAAKQRPFDVDGTLLVDSGGVWSGPVVVPTGTAPGMYSLAGECTGSRSYTASYTPRPITVLAGT